MRIFFFLLCSFVLFSCTENDTKKDIETNTYYSKYLYIYNNYDSLGIEASINLLDEYIKEFPNAQNAYKFKAWLLAQDGNFEDVNSVLKKAMQYDEDNLSVYAYWVSLLLKDTNSFQEAQRINEEALTISEENIELLHNKTWIHLFKNENDQALKNALKVSNADTTNSYLYTKTVLISSISLENDSIFDYHTKDKSIKKVDSIDLLKFKKKELSLLELFNKKID